jgi:hypothetical protein
MVGRQDPVEVINEALDRLADEDRSNWSVAAKTQRTIELTKLGARVEAETVACVGEWEAAGGWQVGGSRSPAAALAWLGGRSPGVAQKFLQTGRLVRRHASTAKSMANGDLKIDLAHQLGRAVTEERKPIYERDEHTLLDAARRLDAKRFKVLIDRWVEMADDEVDPDKEFERFDRRELKVGQLLDGLSDVRGTFEAEGTALLRKVLDAYRKPDPAAMIGGRRSNAQTNYDALMAALAAAVDGKEGRPLRTTDAVVSYELLQRLPVTDLENMRCDLIGAGPVPPSLLRRLAADSAIGRLIADADGVPLELGTQVRLFTAQQRRALRFRDQICVWPGCDLPGEWTEMDHAVDAALGGATDVRNGRFLCVRHHHLRHKGWDLVYDPVTRACSVTSPLGITWTADRDIILPDPHGPPHPARGP